MRIGCFAVRSSFPLLPIAGRSFEPPHGWVICTVVVFFISLHSLCLEASTALSARFKEHADEPLRFLACLSYCSCFCPRPSIKFCRVWFTAAPLFSLAL